MIEIIFFIVIIIIFIFICIELCKLDKQNDKLKKEINKLKEENSEIKNENDLNESDIYKYAHEYHIEKTKDQIIIKIMFLRYDIEDRINKSEDLYEFLTFVSELFDNKEITVIINCGKILYNRNGNARYNNFNNINLKISDLCDFYVRSGEIARLCEYNNLKKTLYSNNFKSIQLYNHKKYSNYKI